MNRDIFLPKLAALLFLNNNQTIEFEEIGQSGDVETSPQNPKSESASFAYGTDALYSD